jgi:hypothetical protein
LISLQILFQASYQFLHSQLAEIFVDSANSFKAVQDFYNEKFLELEQTSSLLANRKQFYSQRWEQSFKKIQSEFPGIW